MFGGTIITLNLMYLELTKSELTYMLEVSFVEYFALGVETT